MLLAIAFYLSRDSLVSLRKFHPSANVLSNYRAAKAHFWKARPPKWRSQKQHATATATAFYSANSRQGVGVGGHASWSGPELQYDALKNYSYHVFFRNSCRDLSGGVLRTGGRF